MNAQPQTYALPSGATTQSQAALLTTQNNNTALAALIKAGGTHGGSRRRRRHGVRKSRKNISRKRHQHKYRRTMSRRPSRRYMRGGVSVVPTVSTLYSTVSPQSVQSSTTGMFKTGNQLTANSQYDNLVGK